MIPSTTLPQVDLGGHIVPKPEKILQIRERRRGRRVFHEALVQWSGQLPEEATWESLRRFLNQYPDLVDKVVVEGEGSCYKPSLLLFLQKIEEENRKKRGEDGAASQRQEEEEKQNQREEGNQKTSLRCVAISDSFGGLPAVRSWHSGGHLGGPDQPARQPNPSRPSSAESMAQMKPRSQRPWVGDSQHSGVQHIEVQRQWVGDSACFEGTSCRDKDKAEPSTGSFQVEQVKRPQSDKPGLSSSGRPNSMDGLQSRLLG